MNNLDFLTDLGRRRVATSRRLSGLLRTLPVKLEPQLDQTGLLTPPSLHVEAHQLAERWTDALEAAQIAVCNAPKSWEAWAALARALAFKAQRKAAQRALRRAIQYGGQGPEISYLGAVLSLDDKEALDLALDAAESAHALYGTPYADALFLAAKTAREIPASRRSAQALLERIAPLMAGSVLRKLYDQAMIDERQ